MADITFGIKSPTTENEKSVLQKVRRAFLKSVSVDNNVRELAKKMVREGWTETRDFKGKMKSEYKTLSKLEKMTVLARIGSGHLSFMVKFINTDTLIEIVSKISTEIFTSTGLRLAIKNSKPDKFDEICSHSKSARKNNRKNSIPSSEKKLAFKLIPKAMTQCINKGVIGEPLFELLRQELLEVWPLKKAEKDFLNYIKRYEIKAIMDLPKVTQNEFNRLACWHKKRLLFLAFPYKRSTYQFVYPYLLLDHWVKVAKGCAGWSKFSRCGGGWIAKHKKQFYRELNKRRHLIWIELLLAANGTVLAESYPELIFFNFLYHNRKIVSYEPHPEIDRLKYKSKKRSMAADAYVKKKTDSDWKITVEICSFKNINCDRAENWERSKNILERNKFKIENKDKYPYEVVFIDADIFKNNSYLMDYVEEVKSKIEEKIPVRLSIPSENTLMKVGIDFLTATPLQIAEFMIGKNMKKLSDLVARKFGFIYNIILYRKISADVEKVLAKRHNRPANVRVIGKAPESEVMKFVRENNIDSVEYEKMYSGGELPENFPKFPKASYPGWSWPKARGENGRTDFIKDFKTAKRYLQDYQKGRLTGKIRFIKNGTEYEKIVKNDKLLKGKVPLQPDNPKSGGLDGWTNWRDYLNNPVADEYYRNLNKRPSRNKTVKR